MTPVAFNNSLRPCNGPASQQEDLSNKAACLKGHLPASSLMHGPVSPMLRTKRVEVNGIGVCSSRAISAQP